MDEPIPHCPGAPPKPLGNAAGAVTTATKPVAGGRGKNPQPLKKQLFNIGGTSGGISVGATPPTPPPITPMDGGTVISGFFRQDRRLSADDLSPTIRGRRTSLQVRMKPSPQDSPEEERGVEVEGGAVGGGRGILGRRGIQLHRPATRGCSDCALHHPALYTHPVNNQ